MTVTTDYAVRIMLFLYSRKGSICLGEEICSAMGIPQNYLGRLMRKLKKAGWVHSYHGQNGGYQIAEASDTVSLYDILHLMEPEKINRCLEDDKYCSRDAIGCCAVHRFYQLAQEDWDRKLKKMTLRVLAADPSLEEIERLLDNGHFVRTTQKDMTDISSVVRLKYEVKNKEEFTNGREHDHLYEGGKRVRGG